jgi:hypothetical protein
VQAVCLFDHFVGDLLQMQRYGQAKRFRRFQVDQQLEGRRLLDRDVAWWRAL